MASRVQNPSEYNLLIPLGNQLQVNAKSTRLQSDTPPDTDLDKQVTLFGSE